MDAGKGEKKVQQEKDSKSEAVEKDHNVDSSSLGNKVAHSMMQNNIVKEDTKAKAGSKNRFAILDFINDIEEINEKGGNSCLAIDSND